MCSFVEGEALPSTMTLGGRLRDERGVDERRVLAGRDIAADGLVAAASIAAAAGRVAAATGVGGPGRVGHNPRVCRRHCTNGYRTTNVVTKVKRTGLGNLMHLRAFDAAACYE